MADVEYSIKNNPDHVDKDNIRCKCTNVITNFLNRKKTSNPRLTPTKKDFQESKIFLNNNKNLIVAPADKGNITAILYKDHYNQKLHELLDDKKTYTKLQRDPTNKYKTKSNMLVNSLYNNNIISKQQVVNLKNNNPSSPRLYGLCKIHKEGHPIRPIVSCINAPGYNLSKYIHNILSNLTPSFQFNVKNSEDVVQRLKTVTLPEDHVLISLDVKSLFTNIPLELVLNIIEEQWSKISAFTTIDFTFFQDLIRFCFDSSYFSYDNEFYQQIFGMPMGDPVSPILSALVMDHIANEALSRLNFLVPLLLIYVDDTLLAIPKNKIDDTLSAFNNVNPNLQFTIERETNNQLPFLDLLIIKEDNNRLITDLYSKPTNTDRLLNYNSIHALSQKINIVKQFHNKIYKLSHPKFHTKNLTILKEKLIKNNYPKKLVNSLLNQKAKVSTTTNNTNVSPTHNTQLMPPSIPNPQMKFFKMPNIPMLTNKLKTLLTTANSKVALYNTKTIGNTLFTKLKDKIPITKKTNVVYEIKCNNCPNNVYIGQTSQNLEKRIYQHKYDCNITNLEKTNQTALSMHHFRENHNFNFNSVRILDSEPIKEKREFIESTYILKNKNSINLKTDCDNLSRVYHNVITNFP